MVLHILTSPPQSAFEYRLLAVDAYPFAVPNLKFREHYDDPTSAPAGLRFVCAPKTPLTDSASLLEPTATVAPRLVQPDELYKFYPPRNAPPKAQQVLGFLITANPRPEGRLPLKNMLSQKKTSTHKPETRIRATATVRPAPTGMGGSRFHSSLDREIRAQDKGANEALRDSRTRKGDGQSGAGTSSKAVRFEGPDSRHVSGQVSERRATDVGSRPTHKRSTSWPHAARKPTRRRPGAVSMRSCISPAESGHSTQSETFLFTSQDDDDDLVSISGEEQTISDLTTRASLDTRARRDSPVSPVDYEALYNSNDDDITAAIDYMCQYEASEHRLRDAAADADQGDMDISTPSLEYTSESEEVSRSSSGEWSWELKEEDFGLQPIPRPTSLVSSAARPEVLKQRSKSMGSTPQDMTRVRNFARPFPPRPGNQRVKSSPSSFKTNGGGPPMSKRAERPLSTIMEGDANSMLEFTVEEAVADTLGFASRQGQRPSVLKLGDEPEIQAEELADVVKQPRVVKWAMPETASDPQWSPHLTPDKITRRRGFGGLGRGRNMLCV